MKKIESISFRTDEETKRLLSEFANSKKWSISLLVEDIVQQWIKENKLQKEEHDE
jgi:predicted transcriptional regulator